MLFIIEDDLISSNDDLFLQCLDTLLLGYVEGNHLLYIKPKNVKKIHKLYGDNMSDSIRNRLFHYEQSLMLESKILYNLVNHAIKIVPENFTEERVLIDNHSINCLYSKRFIESSNIQKSTLLCENINDADIYNIMALTYIEDRNISENISLKNKVENGGGNTTAAVFKRKISDNEELCICLLDSDKRYPSDLKMGETAKRLKRLCHEMLTPKYLYYIESRCKELENMLPLDFYFLKYQPDINKKDIFPDIDIMNEIDDNLIYYFDLKNGLTYFDIIDYPDWSNLNTASFIKQNELLHHRQEIVKKSKCNCKIINGFGTKILEDFISTHKNNINIEVINKIITDSPPIISNIWREIGKLVFSWCCGHSLFYSSC